LIKKNEDKTRGREKAGAPSGLWQDGDGLVCMAGRWSWKVIMAPRKESYQEMQKAKQSKIARFFTKYDGVMR
jgi:hypothetical protein